MSKFYITKFVPSSVDTLDNGSTVFCVSKDNFIFTDIKRHIEYKIYFPEIIKFYIKYNELLNESELLVAYPYSDETDLMKFTYKFIFDSSNLKDVIQSHMDNSAETSPYEGTVYFEPKEPFELEIHNIAINPIQDTLDSLNEKTTFLIGGEKEFDKSTSEERKNAVLNFVDILREGNVNRILDLKDKNLFFKYLNNE